MAILDNDGDEYHVPGKPYVIKNTNGVLFCHKDPSFQNQKGPPHLRTCKHLKAVRGDAAEAYRLANGGLVPPGGFGAQASMPAPAPRPPVRSMVRLDVSGSMRPAAPAGSFESMLDSMLEITDGSGGTNFEVAAQQILSRPSPVVGIAIVDDEPYVNDVGETFAPGLMAQIAILTGSSLRPRWSRLTDVEPLLGRFAAEKRKPRPDELTTIFGPPVLLAHPLDKAEVDDLTGWWWSEKWDGVRAYWDGENFISRQGNIFPAPAWFKAVMPKHPMDGELWMGRRRFQDTLSVVKTDGHPDWSKIKYVAYRLPHSRKPFEEMLEDLAAAVQAIGAAHVLLTRQEKVQSTAHLKSVLQTEVGNGAEGVMLTKPGSVYPDGGGRSWDLLKGKLWEDAEGEVVAHVKSTKGQFKGLCGSLTIRMKDGKQFDINAKTVAMRNNPPPVGAWVTYKFMDTTKDGLPKGASIIAVRDYE